MQDADVPSDDVQRDGPAGAPTAPGGSGTAAPVAGEATTRDGADLGGMATGSANLGSTLPDAATTTDLASGSAGAPGDTAVVGNLIGSTGTGVGSNGASAIDAAAPPKP